MRLLYITTTGETMSFFESVIAELIDEGNSVDIATNSKTSLVPQIYRDKHCTIYQLDCARNPLRLENLKTVERIRDIVRNGNYDIVHCHTPVAAICTRLACRSFRNSGLKVIYTAHGFHFFKGAPLKNWLLFYPIEKMCSRFTDVLITINQEDYQFAQKKMKANKIVYVPGVGIDLQRFSGKTLTDEQRLSLRKELGVQTDEKMLFSVGELSHRKNHEVVIRALAQLNLKEWKYFIAGEGALRNYLVNLISDLGLANQVFLLGQRNDIPALCECCELFVFPSLQEGLPVALMEAIASKRPVICSKIRGNTDLVEDGLFDPKDVNSVVCALQAATQFFSKETIDNNYSKLSGASCECVNKCMIQIYEEI